VQTGTFLVHNGDQNHNHCERIINYTYKDYTVDIDRLKTVKYTDYINKQCLTIS